MKSSHSNASCVDVVHDVDTDQFIVTNTRDTTRPNAIALVFTRPEWNAFIKGVRDGEFDFPAEPARPVEDRQARADG